MTSCTMSCFSATGSISTPRDMPQPALGQLYETVLKVLVLPGAFAFTAPITAVLNGFLQCGQLLMGPPSLVGSGVEIASYREGGSSFAPEKGEVA